MISAEAREICNKLQELGTTLIGKFRNSQVKIASDTVTKLYDLVRDEDTRPRTTADARERPVDNINVSKKALNETVNKSIQQFFSQYVIPNLQRVSLSSNMDFLNILLHNWAHIKVFAMVFKFILSRHHNHYIHAFEIREDCSSIAQLMLDTVRQRILRNYKQKILCIINETFEKQRNLENTEKEKVKQLIDIIQNCGLYQLADVTPTSFRTKTIQFKKYQIQRNEKLIIPKSDPIKYFRGQYFESIWKSCVQSYKKRISQLPTQPSEYVAEVLKILKSERERTQYYFFDYSFKQDYLSHIQEELVDKRIQDVLNSANGLDSFIESSSEKDLVGTYTLCKRRQAQTFTYLKQKIQNYFISSGLTISDIYLTSQKKDPFAYIQGMIAIKKKFNQIVEVFFKKDLEFTKVRNQICRDILRYEGDQSKGVKKIEAVGAKNLAIYTDKKVRQCAKIDAADKVEEILDNIILVFQSLLSQDKYLSQHQLGMSKRLLEPYSSKPNTQVQKNLISKLSQIVGPKDVQKHLGMIKDYDWSGNFEQKLNQKLQGTKVRIQPFVLQGDYWPDNQDVDITFPTALISEKSKVEAIFSNITAGKFLIWKVNRGVSQLQAKFGVTVYRFTLNNLMMFILLHISEGKDNQILYGQLKQMFRLKRIRSEQQGGSVFDGEFKLNLLTLIEYKLVLRDRGLQLDINQGETLRINLEYVYVPPKQELQKKGPKLKVSNTVPVTIAPSLKLKNQLKVGTMNTNEIIKKKRQVVMDSVIVQLMKNYKTLKLEPLIEQMKKHRQMQNVDLKIIDVKDRIQHLITNDFVERDESDRNTFIYKP